MIRSHFFQMYRYQKNKVHWENLNVTNPIYGQLDTSLWITVTHFSSLASHQDPLWKSLRDLLRRLQTNESPEPTLGKSTGFNKTF